jgi:hypothetical protein
MGRASLRPRPRLFRIAAASAVAATRPKVRRCDQIFASYVRAQTLGDFAGQRNDGIMAHELREKRQLSPVIGRVPEESSG